MKRAERVMLILIILIGLVIGLYYLTFWISKLTGYSSGEAEIEKVVKCLNERETKVYGALLNANWEKQKEKFGGQFEGLNYQICNETGGTCKGLQDIPAWYANGSVYYGVKSLEELSEIAKC